MQKKLFDSTSLAGITLRNRFIRSATHEGMASPAGSPTPGLTSLYEKIAQGGAGAIITGYAGVSQEGKSSLYRMLMIDNDALLPAYRELTDRVHAHGVPVILQVAHCGRQTRSKITGLPTVAPSSLRDFIFNEARPHELNEAEIEQVIDDFVKAAVRAKAAGFDGVQLHMAHGYLLAEFLSGYTNRRRDRWGRNTENRSRIAVEIIRRTRNAVGNFPVLAKINGFDNRPGGMRPEEAVQVARMLEHAGCDAIEISSGIIEEGFSTVRGPLPPLKALFTANFRFSELPGFVKQVAGPVLSMALRSPRPLHTYNAPAAGLVRSSISIPVMTVGGIHSLEDAARIVDKGLSDYVSMSRPFITEPDIVEKFRTGKQARSRCIMCNCCVIFIETSHLKCWHEFRGRI